MSTPTLHASEEEHKPAIRSPTPSFHSHTSSQPAKDVSKTKRRKEGVAPAGHGGVQAPLELSKFKFWSIFIALMVSIFLYALDQLIVATAIPKITQEFDSLTELSWLASGFFLTLLGFNLIYSQWVAIFPSKHVLLFAVAVFEIGSLVCGVAPNMKVLILGRAIAGIGAAGIFTVGFIVVAEITSLHDRPKYLGLFGICFAIASVLGPLVGGAFSDHVSWRWCFYINLPFGGVAAAMLVLFQPARPPLGRAASYKGYNKDMLMAVVNCDWVGMLISMGWGVVAILFMQWGGVTRPWNDGGVIACAVLTGVIPFIFLLWEWYIGPKAMFKFYLLKRRTIFGASFVLFNLFAVLMLEIYYLSVAFQAAYHTSATGAGVKLFPLIFLQIFGIISTSRIVPIIRRFKWIIVAGPVFMALGSGLLYTVKYGTPINHIYGFSVILGLGIGIALQNPMLAVQVELKDEPWLISSGLGIAISVGLAGRIIGISLAGSVFENMIQVNVAKYAPDLPAEYVQIVVNSATAVWINVPIEFRDQVLMAYTETLRVVYILGLPFSILGLLAALVIKDTKLQSKEEEKASVEASKEKAALAAAAAAKEGTDVEKTDDVPAVENVAPQLVFGGPDAQVVAATQEGKSPA